MTTQACTQIADTGSGMVKSKVYNLTDGWGSLDLTQFLGHSAVSPGGVNRITDLKMRLRVTFTVGGGDVLRSSVLVSGLIQLFNLRDKYGPLAEDLDGRCLLMLQYIERRGYRMPQDTYPAGTYTADVWLRYPCDELQGREGGDGGNWIDLEALQQGDISVTPAIGVGGTIGDSGGTNKATVSAASMQWYCSFVEEGKDSRFQNERTLKQRVRFKRFPISSNSMSNPLSANASLRWNYLDVGPVQANTTTPVLWPATGITVTSSTWGLIDPIETDALDEQYIAHVEPDDLSLLAVMPPLDGSLLWIGVSRKWIDLMELPLDNYANWLLNGITFGTPPLVGGSNSVVSWIEPQPSSATGGCSDQVIVPGLAMPGVRAETLAPAIQAVFAGKTGDTVIPTTPLSPVAGTPVANVAAGPGGVGRILNGILTTMPTGS